LLNFQILSLAATSDQIPIKKRLTRVNQLIYRFCDREPKVTRPSIRPSVAIVVVVVVVVVVAASSGSSPACQEWLESFLARDLGLLLVVGKNIG